MDPWAFLAVALALGLAVAVEALRRSRHRLRQIGMLTGVGREGDPRFGVTRLLERTEGLERTLAEERRDHELRLDLFDVGVVDLDGQLRVVRANAAAHAFLGRAPGTLVGLDALEAFLDTQVEAIAREALARGSGAGEVRLRGADGVTLAVRAQRSTAGGVWLVLADVSELRRLQQIRAEFIDNLSHELRTPLATVSLLAETLARDAAAVGEALPDRMRDRIARIEVETGHLAQMVGEIRTCHGSRPAPASVPSTTSTWPDWPTAPPSGCACSPSGRGFGSSSTPTRGCRRSVATRRGSGRSS